MINFKISLLSPIILENNVHFIQTILTDFLDQETKYHDISNYERSTPSVTHLSHFEYTFNEKYAEEENNQKTLTFEMNKTITNENSIYDNPFINFLHIGSLILFEDKYHNQHLFSIKQINYEPSEFNILYKITCQDTFSYTMAKQKDGYTIENNIESDDFIGAFNIDFWTQKIVKDCYITYDYLPLTSGLCQLENGDLITFSNLDELQENGSVKIKKIIKETYSPVDDKELFTTFPFEGSGTASAILIALGQELGMHLKVAEVLARTTITLSDSQLKELYDVNDYQLVINDILTIKKFFWFEPAKNIKRLDSTYYTPRSSIQKFDMGHNGESLTTILNIEGPTIGNEEITLLPVVTPFFSKVFNNSDFWATSNYEVGMFTKLVKGYSLIGCEDTLSHNGFKIDSIEYITPYIKINIGYSPNLKTLLPLYDTITTVYEAEQKIPSSLKISTGDDIIIVNSYNSIWTLHIENNEDVKTMILGVDEIPSNVKINEDTIIYITIPYAYNFVNYSDANIYLHLKHTPSSEDLEFATVADACPWLENKIIDFSYFLRNNIISANEYGQLMSMFQNNLRRINGQLLVYSYQYYNALHQRTAELASLTNSLDAIGASVEHLFVNNYAKKGININTTDFELSYNALFAKGTQDGEKRKSILNYNDLKAEYINKFCNAQQRFLKNIKNFKDYFNAPITVPTIYQYKLSFENIASNRYVYSYNYKDYQPLTTSILKNQMIYNDNKKSATYGKPYYPIYRKMTIGAEDSYIKILLADSSMIGTLYLPNSDTNYQATSAQEYYNEDYQYYKQIIDNNSTEYALCSPEDIVKNYILHTNKTYYYRKDLTNKTLTLTSEDTNGNRWNSILNQFKTWFKPRALSYIYASPNWEWDEADNWEYKYYKIFNAYLPISSYVDSSNDSKQYTAVTPENSHSYYFPCQPIGLTGKLVGHSITHFTLGAAGHIFWSLISKWINSSKACQILDVEGVARYDLTLANIQEYNSSKHPIIYTNAMEVYDKWCDSIRPFYTLNGIDALEETEDVFTITTGITPQLAGAHELAYKYNNIYWIKNDDEYINATLTYVLIPLDKDNFISDDKFNDFLEALGNTINPLTDVDIYPLIASAIQLPSSIWTIEDTTTTKNYNKMTKEELISSSRGVLQYQNNQDKNNGLLKIVQGDNEVIVALCELRNYTLEQVTVGNFDYSKPFYDSYNTPINMLKEEGIVVGLYKKPDDFILADNFDISKIYYIKENNEYSQLYTILSLPLNNCYYKPDNSYISTFDSNNITNFTIDLTRQDKKTLEQSTISVTLDFTGNNTINVRIDDFDALIFTKEITDLNINQIIKTNGDFWYNYYRDIDNPVFNARAAGIEAQLTEYWNQAYVASKYCDYFLPETWTISIEGVANQFASLLYNIIQPNADIELYNIELLPSLLPDVAIYSHGDMTQLKKYKYVIDNNYPTVSSLAMRPIQDMFTSIGANPQDWNVIESGITTYYYNRDSSSGMSWAKFLEIFNLKYPEISGQYKMGFIILNKRYQDCPQNQYFFFKEQQQALWRKIYQKYNFLILEKTYKNDTAATSTDLLKLAQFAFKDYSQPETNYNISIIDLASLSNYDGSEVRIGDGIRIQSNEYYELHDDVFRDLSQYLFVTNISYDCRKATDISLGVNAIKYQDKLIQKLISVLVK